MVKTGWIRAMRSAAVLASALLLLAPALSPAKPMVDDDFSKKSALGGGRGKLVRNVEGRKGFTTSEHQPYSQGGLEYRGLRLSEKTGSIQILLNRQASDPQKDFLFRIDGAFKVVAFWRNDGTSYMAVYGLTGRKPREANDDNELIWGTFFPFGLDPAVGQWNLITLNWGPKPENNRIYLNTTPLKPSWPTDFKPEQPEFKGSGKVYLGYDTEVTFGIATRMGLAAPRNDHTTGSVIGGFFVNDAALTEDEIAQKVAELTGKAVESPAPAIAWIKHDAPVVSGLSGGLVAGDILTADMEATPGQEPTFDVAQLADDNGTITMKWKGFGVYLDDGKVFYEPGEINLREALEYRVYISQEPFAGVNEDTVATETLKIGVQEYVFKDLLQNVPYYTGVAVVMKDGTIRPIAMPRVGNVMYEKKNIQPGLYTGTYKAVYGDDIKKAVVIGRMANAKGEVSLPAPEEFKIDGALKVGVQCSPDELKADEKSTSKVTVTVTNANGDAISGHKIKFVLATTSQYTGVVGGGQFTDQVGGALKQDFWSETDTFGQVEATYTAGFAAKTAIIVARDMASDSVGAGYVKTYIQATAEMELEATQDVAGKALGYAITVTSSDEWLTADGRSTARITATVTKDDQPVEGHNVDFSVSSGTGSIKTVKGITDREGKARAVYTAGTKIGMVLIMATDTTVGLSGSVQIELRSDAPAKINIKIVPEKIPADGHSSADLLVQVTDINDNPNDNVSVEYRLVLGSGRLVDIEDVTNKQGESKATFVAGKVPGKVTFEVTVRSTVPSDEELAKARDLAVAVTDYNFF